MAEKEIYYHVFKYVDGSKEEFALEHNLSASIRNPGKDMLSINSTTLINLRNVIKVDIETQDQREADELVEKEKRKQKYEAMKRAGL